MNHVIKRLELEEGAKIPSIGSPELILQHCLKKAFEKNRRRALVPLSVLSQDPVVIEAALQCLTDLLYQMPYAQSSSSFDHYFDRHILLVSIF